MAVTAMLALWTPQAFSPEARAQEKAVTVVLGSDTGLPGGTVMIPIALKAKEGMKIARLSLEISVPDKLLRLKSVRTSLGAEMAGGEAKAEVIPSPEGTGISILKVTVAAQNGLSAGVLATLEFRIGEEVGDTSKIPLQGAKVTLTTLEGQAVQDVGRQDGEVVISKTPPTFVNCFFFNH